MPEISRYHAHSQQGILRRLDKAYKRFFKMGGYPRFKSRHRGIRSFESSLLKIKQGNKWNSLKIKGIGNLRFKGEIPESLKLVRVVKTPLRVKIQLVHEIEQIEIKDNREVIGIDLGILNNVTLSNGVQIPKRILNRDKIKKKQRLVSRAMKKSKNRVKKTDCIGKGMATSNRTRKELHTSTDK